MEQERIYLAVPYSEKEEAKSLGAAWDSTMKRWYGTEGDEELLAKYKMIDLAVPFDNKEEAKKLGAMWDPSRKCWYCANSNKLLIQSFSPGQKLTGNKSMTTNTGAFSTFVAKPRSTQYTQSTRPTQYTQSKRPTPRVKPTIPGTSGGWGQISAKPSFEWDEFEN